jgi:hypothetical protein
MIALRGSTPCSVMRSFTISLNQIVTLKTEREWRSETWERADYSARFEHPQNHYLSNTHREKLRSFLQNCTNMSTCFR